MTTRPKGTTPIQKLVRVPLAPSRAFELFTTELGSWWPLATHSVGRDDTRGVTFEGRLGGRIVESLDDERRVEWGRVTEWEPPRLVRFSWHPGTDDRRSTDVEVKFTPDGSGTCVELTHTGWERRIDGDAARLDYDGGWDVVLGCYLDLTGSISATGAARIEQPVTPSG